MKRINILIMDVDGTLTDGKIYMGSNGEIFKAFSIKDGCGIHDILIPFGIEPVIITGRESDILKMRCKELGIKKLYQGVADKLILIEEIVLSQKLSYQNIAYIGDDINDLPCMEKIKSNGGIIGCPADAVRSVIKISDFIAEHRGGEGAVRDFIEYLVNGI